MTGNTRGLPMSQHLEIIHTYVPHVESCFSFSQIGQAFFLFWYVALDLAVIKAVLLFFVLFGLLISSTFLRDALCH